MVIDWVFVLVVWDVLLYSVDLLSGCVSQCVGVSISLCLDCNSVGGDLWVGKDVLVVVDLGQMILLLGVGNIDVEGMLCVKGGCIVIDDVCLENVLYVGQCIECIWCFVEGVLLDVDVDVILLFDVSGCLCGQVCVGGCIEIGGVLDWEIIVFVDN